MNTGTVPSKTLRETALALSGLRSRNPHGVDLSLRREATVADFLRHERNVKTGLNGMLASLACGYKRGCLSWRRIVCGRQYGERQTCERGRGYSSGGRQGPHRDRLGPASAGDISVRPYSTLTQWQTTLLGSLPICDTGDIAPGKQLVAPHSPRPSYKSPQFAAVLPDELPELLKADLLGVQARVGLNAPTEIGAAPRRQPIAARRLP